MRLDYPKRHSGLSLALVLSILLSFSFFSSTLKAGEEKPFVVVVASFNNEKWYQKNLDSIFSQRYRNYRIIYVDDASPDGTGALVKEYLKNRDKEGRTTLICNGERQYSMANLYTAIWLCQPHEIVVELDGDDWFPHDNVLSHLNRVYSDEDVWVTYGQFQYHPCGTPGWAKELPQEVIDQNAYRDHSWMTSALRTYYACLFHQIDKEDFLIDGVFVQTAGDFATLFPILEMAGKHSRFIPEVLYIYNVATGINDIVSRPKAQETTGNSIREKRRYSPLKSLPIAHCAKQKEGKK